MNTAYNKLARASVATIDGAYVMLAHDDVIADLRLPRDGYCVSSKVFFGAVDQGLSSRLIRRTPTISLGRKRRDGDQPDPADGCTASGQCRSAARTFRAAGGSRRGGCQRSVSDSGTIHPPSFERGEIGDAKLSAALRTLEGVQEEFNGAQTGGKRVSLADLIVLGSSPRWRPTTAGTG